MITFIQSAAMIVLQMIISLSCGRERLHIRARVCVCVRDCVCVLVVRVVYFVRYTITVYTDKSPLYTAGRWPLLSRGDFNVTSDDLDKFDLHLVNYSTVCIL